MPIPDFQTLMLPLLELLHDGKDRTMREVTESLASNFKLTDDERQELLPSGKQSIFSNRVAWAKTHLKSAGLIDNREWGIVSITDDGRKVLAQKPAMVNMKFLKQFPAYLKFTSQEGQEGQEEKEEVAAAVSTKTPIELMDSSFALIQRATAEELLVRLKKCSPGFFERVVVNVLRKMGYGGVEGMVTGKSGDGGIDGVLKEDKLGLDVVCLQAKRYEDATVGRPQLQGFVGSMDYYKAKKGVLITTSQFSKEAHDFLDRIEGKKVVLIDGPKLVKYMIEYEVGVRLTKQYRVFEVSNDYFDEVEGII